MRNLRDFVGYVNQKLFTELETFSSLMLRKGVGVFSNLVQVLGEQAEVQRHQLDNLSEAVHSQPTQFLSEMSTDLTNVSYQSQL